MKKVLVFSLIFFTFQILQAQENRFQTGIMIGTHLSYSNMQTEMLLIQKPLLHYSVGLLGRYKLKTDLKGFGKKTIIPFGQGVLALDFGLNVVSTGYSYQINDFERFQKQTMFEFPIVFALWDEKNPLMKRKWHRKRQTIYTRIGFIPSFLKRDRINETFTYSDAFIHEQTEFGGFNLSYSYSLGFRKDLQKANTISLEINTNFNLFYTTFGTAEYTSSSLNQLVDFSNHNSYISLRCIYLLKSDIYKTVTSPIIYSPRLH